MSWFLESSEEPLGPTQMVEVKLKPCPICGRNDRLVISKKDKYEELLEKNGSAMISMECKRCDLELKNYDHYNINNYAVLRSMLINRWNERKECIYECKED